MYAAAKVINNTLKRFKMTKEKSKKLYFDELGERVEVNLLKEKFSQYALVCYMIPDIQFSMILFGKRYSMYTTEKSIRNDIANTLKFNKDEFLNKINNCLDEHKLKMNIDLINKEYNHNKEKQKDMKIKEGMYLKFKPRDKVFTIHEDKIKEFIVNNIDVRKDSITYYLGTLNKEYDTVTTHCKRDEGKVFSTKEELIESLK